MGRPFVRLEHQDGEPCWVDPAEVVLVSQHRAEGRVTVQVQGQLHYVTGPAIEVLRALSAEFHFHPGVDDVWPPKRADPC